MEVIKTLKPGQDGTKYYQNKFGERLICVRYRRDKNKKLRYTTVELIMDEGPIRPYPVPDSELYPNKLVWIKVFYTEVDYQNRIKQIGGTWDNDRKIWKLPFHKVKALGLESRIVKVANLK